MRAEEVQYTLFSYFPLRRFTFCPPSLYTKRKKKGGKRMLPVRINLTIIRAISRCPPPQLGLTAQPGQTLHCSEHIMLTPLFPGWRGPQVPVSLPVRVHVSRRNMCALSCLSWREINFICKIKKKKGDTLLLCKSSYLSHQLSCSSPVRTLLHKSDKRKEILII